MKQTMRKMLCILLALCVVLPWIPGTVFAADESLGAEPDNDALFAMYVEQALYGYERTTFGAAARENLNPVEQGIYDALRDEIEAVAASGGSTEFALSDVSGLKTVWTREELGVESIEDLTVVQAEFKAQYDQLKIIRALLSDCPFDLYWFDKTVGASISYSMSRSGYSQDGKTYWTSVTVTGMKGVFYVAAGYQGGDNLTVTSDVAKVGIARTNAQAVVDAYASGTVVDKLVGYRDEICAMVDYNHDNYTGGYGDPWQLIYVFDGDDATKVVCEGYSKAYQYLCDLSGLDCISVTGDMGFGDQGGAHMWNLVTLNGANYLVDVTNFDSGFTMLFLSGTSIGSVAEGYSFPVSEGYDDIVYTYDSFATTVWTESELTVASEGFDPKSNHAGGNATCTELAVCELCGQTYGEYGDHTYADGVCTGCGEAEEITAMARNSATGADYATLAEALAAAGAGETVQLLADCAEDTAVVIPGVTLDLNGKKLTVNYLVAFDDAHVIDEAGGGRLIIAARNVVLDAENAMVPVYDGTGYIFTRIGFALSLDSKYTGPGVRINAMAYSQDMDVVELLKNGCADNKIQIKILLRWNTDQGTASQEFVFRDQLVSDVYGSNNGSWNSYGKMFAMTITGTGGVQDLKANMVIDSDTNAACISNKTVSLS